MQIEKPSSFHDKNIYHELFQQNFRNKSSHIELILIHVGLIHNTMGLAFMELIKGKEKLRF